MHPPKQYKYRSNIKLASIAANTVPWLTGVDDFAHVGRRHLVARAYRTQREHAR